MSVVTGETPIIDLADDLEDGEIDDDDEEEVQLQTQQPQQQQQQPNKLNTLTAIGGGNDDFQFMGIERLSEKLPNSHDDDVVFLGQANETNTALNKSKKPRPLEDDHAEGIENAIAKILKKSGIEPPMPKIHQNQNQNNNSGGSGSNNMAANSSGSNNHNNSTVNNSDDVMVSSDAAAGSAANDSAALLALNPPSRSSRRRKRKKEREREQKKDKEHQKRARRDSMDETGAGGGAGIASDEMDMDEYEMMNVRGGSPPPGGATTGNPIGSTATTSGTSGRYAGDWPEMMDGGGYESEGDNYSSYDSYTDEDQPNQSIATGMGQQKQQRRRQRREKGESRSNARKRRERERERDMDGRRHDGGVGGGAGGGTGGAAGTVGNKRNRRDSGDDKPREPRKLELCKFYLKDCCAKRDKCSYMHKEFPCKYYYLGMDCYAGDECLFHHGEPLTEQLRNILLKHMETAPKEILGDFKRISRDAALNQMTRRHEQLCEQYHMDNTWTSLAGICRLQEQQHAAAKAQANQAAAIAAANANLQQVMVAAAAAAAAAAATGGNNAAVGGAPGAGSAGAAAAGCAIPSLLDMVINPPLDSKPEKKRKSRWAEKTAGKSSSGTAVVVPPTNIATTGATVSSSTSAAAATSAAKPLPAHLDLVNLSEVLSAEHMAKLNKLGISNLEQMLQVPFGQLTEAGLTLPEIGEIQRKAEEAKPKETDTAVVAESANKSSSKTDQDASNVSAIASSNSNSNSNNGFIMVDYTQYLKDAHVGFAGSDQLDDDREEDDEQLVIDDGNDEEDDESETDAKTKKSKRSDAEDDEPKTRNEEETPPMPSVFDLPTFMSNMLGQPTSLESPTRTTLTTAATVQSPTEPTETDLKPKGGAFSKLQSFGEQRDTDERAAFYRDIIRNPFKAHSGDADDSSDVYSYKYTEPHHSNSNSRSLTPTPTPEPGSQSPQALGGEETATSVRSEEDNALGSTALYSRLSMYDYEPAKAALEDARARAEKRERDTDMRLPFDPMKHYMPATEIDAAIFSHVPMRWQMKEVLIEPPGYGQLRLSALHKEQREVRDPRMRRILGLPELSDETVGGSGLGGSTTSTSALSGISASTSSTSSAATSTPTASTSERRERKTSNCISSPDAQQLYESTPSSPPPATEPTPGPTTRVDPRRDPRRAHLSNANPTANPSANFGNVAPSAAVDSGRQILEIRNLLQCSAWYKNLGSNNKIMVNQQLALVFTELKKFHQLETPYKIFDVNFILNNQTLQHIFAKLHIYIDDNGAVVQLPEEAPQNVGVAPNVGVVPGVVNLAPILPNMSQPPPNLVQMLRQPPPAVVVGGRMVGGMPPMAGGMVMPHPHPQFNQPPPNNNGNNNNGNNNNNNGNNNSILGMPPNVGNVMGVMGNNPFNPFANNMNNMNNMNMPNMPNMNNMNNMNMNMPNMNNMNNMNMNMPFNNNGGNGPFKNFPGPGNNNGGGGGGGPNQGRHFNRNRGNVNRNRNN